MRPVLVASRETQEQYTTLYPSKPVTTYLYYDLESGDFIFTAQISIGGTHVTKEWARVWLSHPDVQTIHPAHEEFKYIADLIPLTE